MAYINLIDPERPASIVTMIDGIIMPKDNRPLSEVPLKDKAIKFMDHIREKHSAPTVKNYRWLVDTIIKSEQRGYFFYNMLYKQYLNRKNIRSYIIHILLYDLYDILYDGRGMEFNSTYYKLTKEHQQLIDEIVRCDVAKGLSPKTTNTEASNIATFIKYLEECGVDEISKMTETNIREYMIYGSCDSTMQCRIGKALKRYAEFRSDTELLEKLKLFPKAINRRKIFDPMTQSEWSTLETFLINPESDISKRDRAIGLILLYTGMRSSDVKNLRRQDIDIRKKELHFIQQKTGKPVTIPLRPVMSNAIVDYVRNERPKSDSPILFLSKVKRKNGTTYGCSIYNIVEKIYKKANIRQGKARKGVHLFRHMVADKMMNSGTDISIISGILGHKNPQSTEKYMSTNVDQLRMCALSISAFPLNSPLYAKEND